MAAYAFRTAGGTSSGTSSTSYTSSRGSLVSSEPDLASSQLQGIDDEEKLKRRKRARVLLEGFCYGDSDTGAPERWLSELGVGWVVHLSDDASAGTSLPLRAQRNLTEDWIRALNEITGSTHRFVREQDVPGPVQLVFKETVLKMLPFVDALLAAADLDADTADATNGARAPSAVKLQTLLDVRDAVSRASISTGVCFRFWDFISKVKMETQRRSDEVLSLLSAKEQRLDEAVWNTMEEIRTSILNVRDAVSSAQFSKNGNSMSKVEMETRRRRDEVSSLLSAKMQRLDEAAWNTMEEVRTSILNDDDNEWGILTRQGSPGICKVTRSLVTYIKSLWDDWRRVDHIVRTAAKLGNVPEQDQTGSLTTLTMEMVFSLEVKLHKRSEYFPDHSLRFLFLINYTHFIWQQLHQLFGVKFYMEALTPKIENYIQKYLQVSWEPALSCLDNHTPHYCFRTNSALPKFDLEFQKTYAAQKLWKVPDPELRTRLRKAIVEKVVSGFTKYLEDNNVTNPGITPQEREEMLLELFEG